MSIGSTGALDEPEVFAWIHGLLKGFFGDGVDLEGLGGQEEDQQGYYDLHIYYTCEIKSYLLILNTPFLLIDRNLELIFIDNHNFW